MQVEGGVLAADLKTARHLQSQFSNVDPTVFPGSTTLRLSDLLYNELKTKGPTEMSCQCATGFAAMAGGLGKALGGLLGGPGWRPSSKISRTWDGWWEPSNAWGIARCRCPCS